MYLLFSILKQNEKTSDGLIALRTVHAPNICYYSSKGLTVGATAVYCLLWIWGKIIFFFFSSGLKLPIFDTTLPVEESRKVDLMVVLFHSRLCTDIKKGSFKKNPDAWASLLEIFLNWSCCGLTIRILKLPRWF